MGYTIIIGELEIEKYPDDGNDCSCIGFSAVRMHLDEAPAFKEPTDYTNSRWPSYRAWSNCLEHAGMYDLFFYDGHLIGGHPGVRLITNDLYDEFSDRKRAFEAMYPNVEATYGSVENALEIDETNPQENSTYCRIVWLDFWMKWALENCDTPVIANS